MRRMRSTLVNTPAPALEAEEMTAMVEEIQPVVVDQTPPMDELPLDFADITEAQAENEAEINEAFETTAVLESLAELVAQAQSHGNFNQTSAAVVHTALEYIGRRNKVSITPNTALESFDTPRNRIATAGVVLEGIKEVASKVWQMLVELVKKIIGFMKALYARVFNKAELVAKRAEEFEKNMKEWHDTRASDPRVTTEAHKRFAARNKMAAYTVEGKFPTNFTGTVIEMHELSTKIAESHMDFNEENFFGLLRAMGKMVPYEVEKFETVDQKFPFAEEDHYHRHTEGDVDANLRFATKPTFANMQLVYVVPPAGRKGLEALHLLAHSKVEFKSGHKESIDPESIPVLSIKEISPAMHAIKDFAKDIIAQTKKLEANKLMNKVSEGVEQAFKYRERYEAHTHQEPKEFAPYLRNAIKLAQPPGLLWLAQASMVLEDLQVYLLDCHMSWFNILGKVEHKEKEPA